MKHLKLIGIFLAVILAACQPEINKQQTNNGATSEMISSSSSEPPQRTSSKSEEPIYYLTDNPLGENISGESKSLYPSPVVSNMTPIPEFSMYHGNLESCRLIFPAEEGTSVKSVCRGTVVMAQDKRIPDMDEEELKLSMLGNYVVVWVGDGISIRYAHLSEVTVEVGQELEVGDKIGVVGYTGVALLQSRQPICGIYVMKDGLQVNPLSYFKMPHEFQINVK